MSNDIQKIARHLAQKSSNPELIESAFEFAKEAYKNKRPKLLDEKDQIDLSELKDLAIIDFTKQKELKDYIDDLIFALYFNVPIKEVGLNKTDKIRKMCEESKFYSIINI